MAYLTAWDASNKLYKRGSSDYPWCAGPRGHSRAQAHVVLSWWKEVDGRDPSPLPAVCPRLLSAGTPLGDYTVPPRSKSQYWNNHKDKHLPLKRARVFSPQAVVPQFFEEGGGGGCVFEAVCQPVLITSEPTRGQKVCSLSATSEAACMHTHSFFAVSRRKEKARAQSTWTQRPSALINYRESGAIDVRITFRSVTASSFSSVVSCILIPGQTDWRRGSGWRVTAQ